MLDKEIHIRFTLADVQRLFVSPFFWVPTVILIFVVPWGSEHAPAWVQAFGSVIAIAAGFAVVSYQDMVREVSRRKESWLYMEKALHAASNAVASVDHVLLELSDQKTVDHAVFRNHQRLLQAAVDDMTLISFVHIEEQAVATAWLGIKRCMLLATAAFQDAVDIDKKVSLSGLARWSDEINAQWGDMSVGIQTFVERHDIDIDR